MEKISIDLWSLENNWAFKNKLVKLNENNKLFSIAKGCFFNFDSLVINLHNYTYNIKFYKEFLNRRTLDILQKSSIYKNLNPTIEANIIRAFFIKQKYDILFSTELIEYIVKKTEHLSLRYNGGIQRIIDIKANYPKYRELVDRCFIEELESIVKAKKKDANDLFLDI